MSFVSCFPVVSLDEEVDLVLCKAIFSVDKCVDLNALWELKIKELIVSEGSEIHIIEDLSLDTLKCFANSDRKAAWYTFVRLLSGNALQLDVVLDIEGSSWKCDLRGDTWKLIWELDSRGITKKNAEIELFSSLGKEVDLFKLSFKLFHDYCKANDKVNGLMRIKSGLEVEIENLKRSIDDFGETIVHRDSKTRTMIVELLNEKKKKIQELERRLDGGLGPNEEPDERLLNAYMHTPASRMSSPKKRRDTSSSQSPTKRVVAKKIKKDHYMEDFAADDFAFMGINRPFSESLVKLEEPQLALNSPVKVVTETTNIESKPVTDLQGMPTDHSTEGETTKPRTPSITQKDANLTMTIKEEQSENPTSAEGGADEDEDETGTETETETETETDNE